jgi:3-(3-hydroxy-phenyl)propionate hydroxylase
MYFMPAEYPPWQAKGRDFRFPVVIVGGGAVGLTLALALARLGVSALVIEDDNRVCDGSRALGMARRTLDIWDHLGVGSRIAAKGVSWVGGRTYYRDKTILEFTLPKEDAYRFPPLLNIQQCYVEQYLVDEITGSGGIEIAWQTRFAGLEQDTDSVSVEIETADGARRVQADYVVACDGARSSVRRVCGLQMEGNSYSAEYLIVDIQLQSKSKIERRAWFDPPSNAGSTVLMHGQPDNIWRVDFQMRDDESIEDALRPDALRERVARHLAAIGEPATFEIVWATTYRAHSRVLSDFRLGRVFFAGDAAHMFPIFGIRGLNSGTEDAFNLAWKLSLALRGGATDQLLDSYSAERLYAARQNMTLANRAADFMTPPTRGKRLMRDAVLSLAVSEQAVRPIVHPRQATLISLYGSYLNSVFEPEADDGPLRAGDVLPNIELRDGHHPSSLCRWLGCDFTLVADGRHLDVGWRDRVKKLLEGGNLTLLTIGRGFGGAPSSIADPDHSVRRMLGLEDSWGLLVRPDHHIAARVRLTGGPELERALLTAQGIR